MLILQDGLAQGSFGSLFHRFTQGLQNSESTHLLKAKIFTLLLALDGLEC